MPYEKPSSESIAQLKIFVRLPRPMPDKILDEVIDTADDLLWCDGVVEALERKLQDAVVKATGLTDITIKIHNAF